MRRSAFTLIELMVVIAIIGILAVSFAPAVGDAVNKAKMAKTMSLINTLETACEMYYGDTGSYAYEYGFSGSTSTAYHQLAYNPGVTGWAGPYIKVPLMPSQNPWGTGWLYLYNTLSVFSTGFDLLGSGTVDKTGNGNCLVIPGVPQKYAQLINDKYDNGIGGNWMNTGRVQYLYNYYLVIYIAG